MFSRCNNGCIKLWDGIIYPSKIDEWKTFQKNNLTIANDVLYLKEMEICPAYILSSTCVNNCEKQIVLLMIPNREKEVWHYHAVKQLSALLTGITSKNSFCCLDCLYSFRTENKPMGHEKVCTSKTFCGTVLLSPKDNILKFDQYLISRKTACISYAYLESLIKTIDKCQDYPERSSTTKIGEDIPC